MMTASQFCQDLNGDPRLRARFAALWRRVDGPAGRCGARWFFKDTSAHVQHCGHPTAHRPYYIVDLAGRIWFDGNGRAFSQLARAQASLMLLTIEETPATR